MSEPPSATGSTEERRSWWARSGLAVRIAVSATLVGAGLALVFAILFLAITGLVLVWLWACDLVVRHVRANRAFTFLYGWSASVIAIYFTHWLVVGWGVGVFGFRSQPLAGALFGIVVAIVATALLSRFAIGLETPPWLERRFAPRLSPPPAPANAAAAESTAG